MCGHIIYKITIKYYNMVVGEGVNAGKSSGFRPRAKKISKNNYILLDCLPFWVFFLATACSCSIFIWSVMYSTRRLKKAVASSGVCTHTYQE